MTWIDICNIWKVKSNDDFILFIYFLNFCLLRVKLRGAFESKFPYKETDAT